MTSLGKQFREVNRLLSVATVHLEKAMDLMNPGQVTSSDDSQQKMDYVSNMADAREKLDEIFRQLTLAAEVFENVQTATKGLKRQILRQCNSRAGKKLNCVMILTNIEGKIREIGRLCRCALKNVEKETEELIHAGQVTGESEEKEKDTGDDSSDSQLKEMEDEKRGQYQLDDDGAYEIYHVSRRTSSDLAGRSADDQRQVTQAEWGLMSDGAKRRCTGQEALEEPLNPAKKIHLDG